MESWSHNMTAGDLPPKEVGMPGAEQSPANYGLTETPQGVHSIAFPGLPAACCLPKQR